MNASRPGSRFWTQAGRRLARLYRSYHRTLRLCGAGPDGAAIEPRAHRFDGEIWALCERDAAALAGLAAAQGFTVLIAQGRDGDWAAAALAELGCRVVRGSSRRGGWPALHSLVRQLADSPGPLAIVVDGPLGPAGRVRAGALVCARESGRPIRPVAAAARRPLVLPRTWSGIYLPLPWSRVEVVLGEPLIVPGGATPREIDEGVLELERRLADARQTARRLAAASENARRLAAASSTRRPATSTSTSAAEIS